MTNFWPFLEGAHYFGDTIYHPHTETHSLVDTDEDGACLILDDVTHLNEFSSIFVLWNDELTLSIRDLLG